VFLRSVFQLLVTANVPDSIILSTLMMEAVSSSETSFLTTATGRQSPEHNILLFMKQFVHFVIICFY
jgi:hypothetical protein